MDKRAAILLSLTACVVETQLVGAEDSELPAVVWVDARGEAVLGAVEMDGELRYIDEDGSVWLLDAATGVLSVTGRLEVSYIDSACTVEWVHGEPTPRYTLLDEAQAYIAPDHLEAKVWYGTYRKIGQDGCGEEGEVLGFAASGLVPVYTPLITWTAPLHPELW